MSDAVLQGLAAVFSPGAIGALLLGVIVGSITGVLPGLGTVGAMAVLMPLSIAFEPSAALLMLGGVYLGAQYGGSTTSILMRVPGEASSVVTSIDGYELTKRGRAGAALSIAAISSFVAGTLAVAALMLVAPQLADVAVRFNAPEFLALGIVGLLVLSRATGGSFTRAILASGLGLAFATIGLDPVNGLPRFTMGMSDLALGVETAVLAVGLFGLAEILLAIENKDGGAEVARVRLRQLLPTRHELGRAAAPMFRGGVIGFLFGLIPGPSAVLSTYASYSVERRVSKRRDEFGHGAIEGVAGPEAANNGATGGAMVPLLALGIPFAAPTAILLGALTLHDVTPGPLLIAQQPELFWTLIAGLYLANVVLVVLNLPLVGVFTQLLRVPRDILMATIVLITVVGVYALRNSVFDVAVLAVTGIVGYLMVKVRLPRAPLVLGFVLGPMIEESLSQTVVLSGGDLSYLLSRPISLAFFAVGVVAVIVPPLVRRARATRSDEHRGNDASPVDHADVR